MVPLIFGKFFLNFNHRRIFPRSNYFFRNSKGISIFERNGISGFFFFQLEKKFSILTIISEYNRKRIEETSRPVTRITIYIYG